MVISTETRQAIHQAVRRGLATLEKPEPLRLSGWAKENFYLSKESSYIEGAWDPWPFQVAIMDAISNDDIRVVTLKKSARVGYTKIIVAAIGYFAEHRKRNQCVWQPVDEDADDFVKDEIETMIRDCPAVRAVFPHFEKKCKQNTLSKKCFRGSTLDIRGGKSAKNYRRMSKDVIYLDELSGFDANVSNEGSPRILARRRLKGATFPKEVSGSTPKIAGSCQIDEAFQEADVRFRYHVPCPHCYHEQALAWGGVDAQFGMKWFNSDPETAHYKCAGCQEAISYDQYIRYSMPRGRWVGDNGLWIDLDGAFRTEAGALVDAPRSVAFHIWAAYSPQGPWSDIVREFLEAKGQPDKLQAFVNTVLGECWEVDEGERTAPEVLFQRREPYARDAAGNGDIPNGVQDIVVGIDTQDDRLELQFDGYGWKEERWTLDYVRLYGDPSRPELWEQLAKQLARTFVRRDGTVMQVSLACQDHGGHYGDEVNAFSKRMGRKFLVPIKGSSVYGKPVARFPRRRNAKGVYLTIVGTDTAKSLLMQRYAITKPGPGYVHWPQRDCIDTRYFAQICAPERVKKWHKGVAVYAWDSKKRPDEASDCSVYSLVAIRIRQQHFGLEFQPYEEPAPAGDVASAPDAAVDAPAPPQPPKKPTLRWK